MRKTTSVAGLPLLAALALAVPPLSAAFAGPPEGAAGKMVLARDEVSEALAKYRHESDPHRRLALLTDLAGVRDPRVAVALGQALYDPDAELRVQAAFGILHNQVEMKHKLMMRAREAENWAREWWAKNEADLRRRAAQLPR
jgi:hypothetical protein